MPNEKEILAGYQQAHNAQDVEGALAWLTPDVSWRMTGLWVRHGTEEMRDLEAWDAVLNGRIEFIEVKSMAGGLTCRSEETNDWYQATGIDQVTYDQIRFEFRDGRISQVRAKLSSESERAIDKVVNQVSRWALKSAPAEINAVLPRGIFNYGAEQAHRWMALLQAWQKSQGE